MDIMQPFIFSLFVITTYIGHVHERLQPVIISYIICGRNLVFIIPILLINSTASVLFSIVVECTHIPMYILDIFFKASSDHCLN